MFLSPVCCPAAQDQQCLPSEGHRSLNLPAELGGARVLEEKLGWVRVLGKTGFVQVLKYTMGSKDPPPRQKKERGRQRERKS